MRPLLPAIALTLLTPLPGVALGQDPSNLAVELERTAKNEAPTGTTDSEADTAVAARLDAKGTPYTVDADGDYRILVNVGEERTQLVWVRSVVHATDTQRIREIWTYGLRSDERRIPAHIANRLLSANMELVVGAWARQGGNALLIIKIDADADAETLDETIDLAASIGDRMEQRLVTGDEL